MHLTDLNFFMSGHNFLTLRLTDLKFYMSEAKIKISDTCCKVDCLPYFQLRFDSVSCVYLCVN